MSCEDQGDPVTLPDERYRALKNMRDALLFLAFKKGPLRKGEFRRNVGWLLKHYPSSYELEEIAKKCPRLLKNK